MRQSPKLLAAAGACAVPASPGLTVAQTAPSVPPFLYDNQTRSMLDTPQRHPRADGQTYPSPAAEADANGSTTIYFGSTQPAGVKRGNWIQTVPGKGWFTILRLYSRQLYTWRTHAPHLVSRGVDRSLLQGL